MEDEQDLVSVEPFWPKVNIDGTERLPETDEDIR